MDSVDTKIVKVIDRTHKSYRAYLLHVALCIEIDAMPSRGASCMR